MNRKIELHESAISLLSLIDSAKSELNNMNDYNSTTSIRTGFGPFTNSEIKSKINTINKLERSYNNIINELNRKDELDDWN